MVRAAPARQVSDDVWPWADRLAYGMSRTPSGLSLAQPVVPEIGIAKVLILSVSRTSEIKTTAVAQVGPES